MEKRQTETAKIEDVPKMGFLRAKELSVMEIGERGYLIEKSPWGGHTKTPWPKLPLYEYVGNQPGSGITIYLFKSVAGNHTVTVSNIDFEIGEYVFCDEPQPREVSVRKPKSKAWDMQAGSNFSMRMNGGGYKL